MNIRKAVITLAGPSQRRLPLQTLIGRDGVPRSVLALLLEEACAAGAEEICLVVAAGDRDAYLPVLGDHAGRVRFVEQSEPLGYGHAVLQARPFTGEDPFLHMVGDHVYVSRGEKGCAAQLTAVAAAEECSVSAVQPTREGELTRFGAVGGQKVPGRRGLYRVDQVLEKPTPTEAEQKIIVPGLRAGQYLCFFGMHVLTPAVMELLAEAAAGPAGPHFSLSAALGRLSERERYLAAELDGRRYDIGGRYGLLTAQLALALSGKDRDEVLALMLDTLAAGDSGNRRAVAP